MIHCECHSIAKPSLLTYHNLHFFSESRITHAVHCPQYPAEIIVDRCSFLFSTYPIMTNTNLLTVYSKSKVRNKASGKKTEIEIPEKKPHAKKP